MTDSTNPSPRPRQPGENRLIETPEERRRRIIRWANTQRAIAEKQRSRALDAAQAEYRARIAEIERVENKGLYRDSSDV